MKWNFLVDVAIGAGAGVGAFFLMKKRYDAECQKKIQEVDDYYKNKLNDLRVKYTDRSVSQEDTNREANDETEASKESETEDASHTKPKKPSYDYTAFAKKLQEGIIRKEGYATDGPSHAPGSPSRLVNNANGLMYTDGDTAVRRDPRASERHSGGEDDSGSYTPSGMHRVPREVDPEEGIDDWDEEVSMAEAEHPMDADEDEMYEALVDNDISDYVDPAFDGLNLGDGIYMILKDRIDEVESGDFSYQEVFYYTQDDLLIDQDDHPLDVEDTIGYLLTMNLGAEFMVYNSNLDIAYHVRIIKGHFNGIPVDDGDAIEMLRRKMARREEEEDRRNGR